MSENFDSQFGNANDDDEDDDGEFGIGSEESGLTTDKVNSFFESASNQPPYKNIFVKKAAIL